MSDLLDVSPAVLGLSPLTFPLALHEPGYELAEFVAFLDEDAEWRDRNPHVVGGPLRNRKGQMVAVPAFMRLDYYTDRDGPVPEFAPHLGPCWVWTGSLTNGYGYVRVAKRKVQAYRLNYERYVGPVLPGMPMDHLCRVRRCVHPLHVEPTTYSENTRRSPIHPGNLNAAKERCPAGHTYNAVNTHILPNGARRCRACQAAAKRAQNGSQPRRLATETHCANGHLWEGNLRVLPSGKRQCATCQRAGRQRFRDKRLPVA